MFLPSCLGTLVLKALTWGGAAHQAPPAHAAGTARGGRAWAWWSSPLRSCDHTSPTLPAIGARGEMAGKPGETHDGERRRA